jgi:hypothetical protein
VVITGLADVVAKNNGQAVNVAVPPPTYDAATGTYVARYTSVITGKYNIEVNAESGSPISGSPFEEVICDTVTDGGQVISRSHCRFQLPLSMAFV